MPKRKVKSSNGGSKTYLTILTNLAILHSPCVSEGCQVLYKHCSGCNESFPCKSAQILAGRSVAQINKMIDGMSEESETITLLGDQAVISSDLDEDSK
jgi:hypothetical protein